MYIFSMTKVKSTQEESTDSSLSDDSISDKVIDQTKPVNEDVACDEGSVIAKKNLSAEEKKKIKNKLKRKKQAAKKKKLGCITSESEALPKKKKFYNPDAKHNNRTAQQIARFKRKHKNPGMKLSNATPEQIAKYKKEYKLMKSKKAVE